MVGYKWRKKCSCGGFMLLDIEDTEDGFLVIYRCYKCGKVQKTEQKKLVLV